MSSCSPHESVENTASPHESVENTACRGHVSVPRAASATSPTWRFYLRINLFNMIMTIRIQQYNSIKMAMYLFRKETTVDASQVWSQYVQWNQRYTISRLTCVASLFFQNAAPQKFCKRKLLIDLQESTMIRHKNSWIYQFPTSQKLTIRCPRNEASPPTHTNSRGRWTVTQRNRMPHIYGRPTSTSNSTWIHADGADYTVHF
jgi:hypothetical protein